MRRSALRRAGLIGALGTGGGSAPVTFDYLIANDADWATVLALGGATLSGKRIGVEPGNYTAKTISLTGASAQVEFIGTNPFDMPRIDKLTLSAANKVTLRYLEAVTSTWASPSSQCLLLTGTNSDLIIERCSFRGNYRGDVDATVDVVNALPEYACITAGVTAGAISALTITQPFVGDLMADGVYALDFSAAGGTGATGTMTVASGVITATSITAGGSGYTTAAAPSLRVTWAGQKRMTDYHPWGIRSLSPNENTNITIRDSTFENLFCAIKPIQMLGTITVVGNTLSRVYGDYISLGLNGTNVGFQAIVTDNFGTLPFSVASLDAGDPHSDFLQFFMDKTVPLTPSDWEGGQVERNIFIDGVCRGSVQGILCFDPAPGLAYSNWRVVGNLIASKLLGNGIVFDALRDCYVRNNGVIRYDPTDTVNNTNAVNISTPVSGGDAYGTSYVGRNISEGLITASLPTVNTVKNPTTLLGTRGATIPYVNVFAGHTGARTTLAEIIAAYTPKVAYAGQGPFADTAYINHVAKTTDRAFEPTYVHHADQVDVAASTLTTSGWSRAIGGPATRSISITGGEYRTADDAAGTNATAWTSAAGTLTIGKFVQLRQTSGAGSSATTSTALTIGSEVYSWSITTVSTASYPVVAFVHTDPDRFSRGAGALDTADNALGTLALLRVKTSAPPVSVNIFGAPSGSVPLNVAILATGFLRVTLRNAANATLAIINSSISIADGNAHDILVSWDVSQASSSGSVKVFVDGTDRTGSITSWAGSGSVGWTVSNGGACFGGLVTGSSTANYTGEIGAFYLNTAARVDITSAVERAKFNADRIGTTGTGPTGAQPRVFLVGNAAQWNAGGGVNRGSGAAYVAISPAAVTDVSGSAWS